MELRLLGPLELVGDDGRLVALPAGKPRALLALLGLEAGRIVSLDRIVEVVWAGRPPATATKVVQGYVSRLRKLLPEGVLLTRGSGYVLQLDDEQLDLARFERLCREAASASTEGRHQTAAQLLRQGLVLWRGLPVADVADQLELPGELARLEDSRLVALEDQFEAELALGQGPRLVAELEGLVARYPLRERLRADLMLALYRAGRQSDALSMYRETRRLLVDELGIEPSTELQQLERRILAQDESLSPAADVAEFPALPVAMTPLVGRLQELAEVSELLGRPGVRLVTLVGPGGVGKTRLALAVAEPRTAVFVSLASLQDATLVDSLIAHALGITAEDTLGDWLRSRELLLVLDNFEHLLDAAPRVTELLAAAPGLQVLATSRSSLNVSGEHRYTVPPLPADDAADLFIERAAAVDAVLEAGSLVETICQRLDCLPLAIELAAARSRTLTPALLLERLEQRLPLLAGGVRDRPERQRTLRATIEWSYTLLTPEERTLFARLAVFHGGSSLEAAEQVCGGSLEALDGLVGNSLLQHQNGRYTMLETIREHARERLQQSSEMDTITRRHAEHFLAVAERIEEEWRKGDLDLLLVELDHDNFRAALSEFVARNDHESAVWLIAQLTMFWHLRGHLREATRWIDVAVQLATDLPPRLQIRAWDSAAIVYRWQRDLTRAQEFALRALEASRRAAAKDDEAWALRQLGVIAQLAGDLDEARVRYDEAAALFRELDEPQGLRIVAHDQGCLAIERGDYASARVLLDEARARAVALDWDVGAAALELGILALYEQRYDESLPLFVESLESALRYGRRPIIPLSLRGIAASAIARGDLEPAARMLGAAEGIEEADAWPELDGYEHDAFNTALAPLLDRTDEPALAAARAAGRRMSDVDAAAFALATVARNPSRVAAT